MVQSASLHPLPKAHGRTANMGGKPCTHTHTLTFGDTGRSGHVARLAFAAGHGHTKTPPLTLTHKHIVTSVAQKKGR